MRYWLMKSEPEAFSWQELQKNGTAMWDGVRNYAARNHMRAMEVGDLAFFYHSNTGKEIVGILRVTKAHYPDPTAEKGDWSVVEVAPVQAVKRPVALASIRAEQATGGVLKDIRLIREGRLSVVPLTEPEWQYLLQMAQTKLPQS